MLMALDARGFEVSAGSACSSGAVEPSPVLTAMGVPRDVAVCAVRLSMGRTTHAADVGAIIGALRESVPIVAKAAARALAAAGPGTSE
jgi:cysteine desulfurase